MKTRFTKRLTSAALAAVMLLGITPAAASGAEDILSPRAVVEIGDDGYLRGITGPVSADFVISQFEGDATVKSFAGTALEGDTAVSSDSTVTVGDTTVKVFIPADVSRDGKINLTDVSSMMKSIARWGNDICTAAGDINGDGKMTLIDTSTVMQYIAAWDVVLAEPLTLETVKDGKTVYSLAAGDLGETVAERFKERSGYDISCVDAASGDEKMIVVGRDLELAYSFIDADAANAIPADEAYVDTYGRNIYITYNSDEGMECAVECAAALADADLAVGYVGEASPVIWSGAANRIRATEIDHEGKNYMNADILLALEYAEFTEPKNIIFLIGDGMGQNIIDATEAVYADVLYGGTTAMNYLPNRADQSTYSANYTVTDSASGGTALATGRKTTNGTVAMYEGKNLKTLIEVAAEQGKDTGIIATHTVTDATPAVFTSHVSSRDQEQVIASQQLSMIQTGDLDLVMGGGRSLYETTQNYSKIEKTIAQTGMTYVNNKRNWDDVLSADPDAPLLALFGTNDLDMMEVGLPSLAQMTDVALQRLSRDKDGFFIMVEGSSIDSYAHGNDFGHQAYDCYDFDCAVAVAMRFAALNPDTVVLVTADHETGSLSIPADPTTENIQGGYSYGSGSHSAIDVPVLSVGYRTEEFTGRINENVDVAIFLASLMSDEEFGETSVVYDLADMTDEAVANAVIEAGSGNVTATENGVTVAYDADNVYMSLPADAFATPAEDVENSRVIHVTMTNKGDSPIIAPWLVLTQDGEDFYGEIQIEWIDPGETRNVSYVLPNDIWWDGYFARTSELILNYNDGTEALIEISDIKVTHRELEY